MKVFLLLCFVLVGWCTGSFLDDAKAFVFDGISSLMGTPPRAPAHKISDDIEHGPGVEVVDFSEPNLPKVRMGARVIDLVHAGHLDDLHQDSPEEIKAPSAVVFYDSNDASCMSKYNALRWDSIAETEMPARERLLTARYDMYSAPRRPWYKFTPEMDLPKRFNVKNCPELVFVPRKCNGLTKWCSRGEDPTNPGVELIGCEDFIDQCTDFVSWDGKGSMSKWLKNNIKQDGEPKISPFFKTYEEQGIWMQKRDHTSSDNHMRNIYLAQAFPGFTNRGFKALETPKPFQDWLLGFHERHEKNRRTEFWDAESTQMSFHEVMTSFLDMDKERFEKERLANEYIKPIVEEWAGIKPLELTSFYGQREYPNGSWLKNHVDRIDTHVLSVTISIKKLDPELSEKKPWPLEVIQWSGDHVRYDHPAGTMILYESSKLPHGRPYKNEGGVHVGAFCHFKPVNMHTKDAAKWDDVVKRARKNQNNHIVWAQYRATKSVEPENPVYSTTSYGDKSKWKHLDEIDSGDANNGQIQVFFKNKSDRILDVYWESFDGDAVLQGTVGVGASFQVNSFPMHKFFWAEQGSTTPVPGGRVTMEKGRTEYVYKMNKH